MVADFKQSIFAGFILHFRHLSAGMAFQEYNYRHNHQGDDEKHPDKLFQVRGPDERQTQKNSHDEQTPAQVNARKKGMIS